MVFFLVFFFFGRGGRHVCCSSGLRGLVLVVVVGPVESSAAGSVFILVFDVLLDDDACHAASVQLMELVVCVTLGEVVGLCAGLAESTVDVS